MPRNTPWSKGRTHYRSHFVTVNVLKTICFVDLQLQVQLQSGVPQPDLNGTTQSEDDVDAALTDLQLSLEGSSISNSGDITHIPELHDYLRFFK